MTSRTTPPRVLELASHLRRTAEMLLDQMGSFTPVAYGARFDEGKLRLVVVPYRGDFSEGASRLKSEILRRYPYAVFVAETWLAGSAGGAPSQAPGKQEAVVIDVHTLESSWTAVYVINRSGDKPVLQDAELHQISPGSLRRRDRSRIPEDPEKLAKAIGKAVRCALSDSGQEEARWKDALHQAVETGLEAGIDLATYARAYVHPCAIAQRVRFLEEVLEAKTCSLVSRQDAAVEYRLLGLRVHLKVAAPGQCDGPAAPDGCPREQVSAVLQGLGDALAKPIPDALSFVAPDQPLMIGASNIDLNVGLLLRDLGIEAFSRQLTQPRLGMTEADPDKVFERIRGDSACMFELVGGTHVLATFPLIARVRLHGEPLLPYGLLARRPELDRTMERLVAVARHHASGEPHLAIRGLEDLRTAVRKQAHEIYEEAVDHRARISGQGPLEAADLVAAFVEETFDAWISMTMHFRQGVQPLHLPALRGEHHGETSARLADHLRRRGVPVRIRHDAVIAHVPQFDTMGSAMEPTFDGGWMSALALASSAASQVLRDSNASAFLRTAESADPAILALPYPHRVIRLGLSDLIGRHYSSAALHAIKHAFSRPGAGLDQAWRDAGEEFAPLGRLMMELPALARLSDPLILSMQLHWSHSPTVVARKQLLERLEHIDVGDKLPAAAIAIPFRFFYVHYEQVPVGRGTHALLASNEGDSEAADDEAFRYAGAFVREPPDGSGRQLEVTSLLEDRRNPLSVATSRIVIELREEHSLTQALELALVRAEVGFEMIALERLAVVTLLKILFYMGSRDARKQVRDDRSAALKDIGKRTPEKREKLLSAARGYFDHILVGPETGLTSQSDPGGRAITKVFVRRGHVHHYWVGKGRTQLISHIIDPVVVNRRLLGGDETGPAPKNYVLQ